jgi:hypothetical protein
LILLPDSSKSFLNTIFSYFSLDRKVSKRSRLPGSFSIFYGMLTHAQQQLDPLRGSQTFAAQGLSQAHKP